MTVVRPTRWEERRLARRARRGDRSAADLLVTSHLYLVMQVAHSSYAWARGLPLWDDIIQEGRVGLTIAVSKFETRYGVRLSTYAVPWIRSLMSAYVTRTRGPVRVGSTARTRPAVNRVLTEAWRMEEEGLDPDRAELASRLGLRLDELELMTPSATGMGIVYLDALHDDGGGRAIVDGGPSPEEAAIASEERRYAREAVDRVLATMTDRERTIVEQRMLRDEPTILRRVGDMIGGVTRERVRQLEVRTRAKLFRRMRAQARTTAVSP